MADVTPADLTDEMIRDAAGDGVIDPSLASAAIRQWHTGSGAARRAARIEVCWHINARSNKEQP